MSENQLAVIVQESGLEETKAQSMLDQFQDYFAIAAEWEAKAKVIVVTDESQTADMAMARVGRLFLRDKRIAIEKTRKAMKEQALREGKAIDGIANILKALIVPVEKYLDEQEHFVEIRDARIAEEERIAEEQRVELARMAAEEAERKEQERIRKENEQLRKEAERKEAALIAERKRVEAERQEAERKAKAEIEEIERKRIKAEREALEKANAEREAALKIEREKAEKERKRVEVERIKAEVEATKRYEAEKAAAINAEREAAEKRIKAAADKSGTEVICPHCGKSFTL